MRVDIIVFAGVNLVWVACLGQMLREKLKMKVMIILAIICTGIQLCAKYVMEVPTLVHVLITIAVIYLGICYSSRSAKPNAIVQIGLSYIMANGIYTAYVIASTSVLMLFGENRNQDLNAWLINGLLITTAICIMRVDMNGGKVTWATLTPVLLISLPLYMISYALISMPHSPMDRNAKLYVLFALLSLVLILGITLALHHRDQTKHQELDEQIQELLHRAHRSKELIPAIEQELRMLRRQVAQGKDRSLADKLDASIRELAGLRGQMDLDEREECLARGAFDPTGLDLLDSQLISEQLRALQEGVDFEIMVFSPVSELVGEGVISQYRLQVLVGDLFRDALAAVKTAPVRHILLSMGQSPRGYRIRMSDSGPHFPAAVLLHLGEEQSVDGRRMFGYVDIVRTLAGCAASLEIAEFAPGRKLHTKTISIVFDGLSQLRVTSFRPEVDGLTKDLRAAAGEARAPAGRS